MNPDIEQLKRDVAELKTWKEQKTLQQISYPLDLQSINILGKYFLRIIKDVVLYFGGASGRGFETLFIAQDGVKFQTSRDASQTYVVDATSDVFTASNNGYPNDTQLFVFTTDTQPAGLTLGTTYYVVSSSGLTFKLSATLGGSAINITSTGTGIQYIDYAI